MRHYPRLLEDARAGSCAGALQGAFAATPQRGAAGILRFRSPKAYSFRLDASEAGFRPVADPNTFLLGNRAKDADDCVAEYAQGIDVLFCVTLERDAVVLQASEIGQCR